MGEFAVPHRSHFMKEYFIGRNWMDVFWGETRRLERKLICYGV